MLFRATEPIIDPIRKIMPNTGMMDMSPMIAILVLFGLQFMVAAVAVPA